MNPDLMRSTYGKLMYLLQDSIRPRVQVGLKLCLKKPIVTVRVFAEESGVADILSDDLLAVATQDVSTAVYSPSPVFGLV